MIFFIMILFQTSRSLRNIEYPSETKLTSILVKSHLPIMSKNFTTWADVMVESNFARFKFQMSFGRLSYMSQAETPFSNKV